MKKVTVFANSAWNLVHFRGRLIEQLKEGYEVNLISPYSEELQNIEGVTLSFLHLFRTELEGFFNEWRSVRELSKILTSTSDDVRLIFTVKAIVYHYLAGGGRHGNTIAVITGLGHSAIVKGWKQKLFLTLLVKALTKVKRIVVQNREDEAWVKSKIPDADVVLIPGSGVDSRHFLSSSSTDKKYDFIFIGRCLLEKGLIELMEATHLLSKENLHPRLAIVGKYIPDHARYPSSDQWDEFLQLENVQYLGQTSDIKSLLEESRCFLLPSYREGLSRAMLEAQSMAMPCLTTDVAGCRDVVSEATGWLVAPKNSIALKNGMQEVLSTPLEELMAKGQRARNEVEQNYDISIINAFYLDLIESILYE